MSDYTRCYSGVTHSLDPTNTGYGIGRQLAQLFDFARLAVPEIDTVTKTNGQNTAGAPIDKIEIEIIGQFRGIEHLVGDFADSSRRLARRK